MKRVNVEIIFFLHFCPRVWLALMRPNFVRPKQKKI